MVTHWKIENDEAWIRVDGRPWLLLHLYTTQQVLEMISLQQ